MSADIIDIRTRLPRLPVAPRPTAIGYDPWEKPYREALRRAVLRQGAADLCEGMRPCDSGDGDGAA